MTNPKQAAYEARLRDHRAAHGVVLPKARTFKARNGITTLELTPDERTYLHTLLVLEAGIDCPETPRAILAKLENA